MRRKIVLTVLLLIFILTFPVAAFAEDKWQGTDDLVDSKMKEVAGVEAREPLIDISQGNLGLFIFTIGGFAAGTLFGYYWRKLFSEKAGKLDG